MCLELDFLRKATTERLTMEEKCNLILRHIAQGRIVVVEAGLEPIEVAELISNTMDLISEDVEAPFRGVEIVSPDNNISQNFYSKRFLFRKPVRKENLPTVITPAEINMRMSIS